MLKQRTLWLKLLKLKLNSLNKELKRAIKKEREFQRETKLRKVKTTNNANNWKQVKKVLALKTDKSKLKLFEETVKQVFCINIQFDSNLLKEKEKVETRYVNIEKELWDQGPQSFDAISSDIF